MLALYKISVVFSIEAMKKNLPCLTAVLWMLIFLCTE